MAEEVYTARRGASVVAWIALVISIIALIIAWMAYNRTGADLEKQIQIQVEKGINAAEDATQDASDAVDAGPDGVDEDDTDTGTGTDTTEPTTQP
jgi:hypothetical protein